MRVLAALSGGVDSAAAAARAVDAGHEVVGVHLALSSTPAATRSGSRGCCSLEDARDARRVADALGIPFYVWDVADRFGREVVEDFVTEYAAGRTPNPCIRCNERIKFAAVLDRALGLGFEAVCTGHYARIVDGALHRAVDAGKDQSYVLSVLTPEQISRALFPVGRSSKAEIRAEAARRGLLVADKPDSHDICFIADGDTQAFLRDRIGPQPGPIVDAVTGEQVGEHDGAYGFTVGQRRGLRLGTPAADGRPRYVLSVSVVDRTVTVGPGSDLEVARLQTGPVTWCGPTPDLPAVLDVQVRAHGEALPAVVYAMVKEPDGQGLEVSYAGARPRGVAAGQTAALYDGTRVVGSASITATG